MNDILSIKLNSLLNLDKPKKSIGVWNISELCNKINVQSNIDKNDVKFDYTFLYHYLGLKVINEYSDKKDLLAESYELLKISFYSQKYNSKLDRLKMLTQLVASGVICSKIAEVRMLLVDEHFNDYYLHELDNNIDKLYAATLVIYLLSVRKMNGWKDVDDIDSFGKFINEISNTISPNNEDEIYFISACFNLEEAINTYKDYIITGKPANVEKVIIRKIFAARDLFNEIGENENALISLLILHSLKEMISNSLWSTIEGISQKIDDYLHMILIRDNDKPIFDLWPSQKSAIKQNLFDTTKSALVVQMPTSAGKSLLAKLYIMQMKSVYADAKIAYLVPTRALVNQVKRDLKSELSKFGFNIDIAIPFMDIDEIEEELLLKNTDIIVTTPEKFDIMQRAKHPFIDKLKLVIVDEAHNIQSSGRGAKLELLLAMLRKNDRNLKILMLSPFMKNANEIASWLSGDRGLDILVNWKPSQQFTGISTNVGENRKGHKQIVTYIPCACNDIYSEEFSLDLMHSSRKETSKLKQAYLIAEKYKQLGGVLILCTQQKYAESLAKEYLKNENISNERIKNISILLELVETEMGNDSLLYNVLKKGCAYHHSALPLNIREEIEEAIRLGYINVVAATTTLAQGMNFPIATVVFQGMTVFDKNISRPLSPSEFWNIAGRAGRALVDKEGHVLSICNDDSQKEQFRGYLVNRNEEVLSSLLSILKELPEECLSSGYIERYGELSAFLQYIYHTMKIYSDIEIDDLLRGSYVYSNLERMGEGTLAEKLLVITRNYISKIDVDLKRKKLMDVIDKTGLSSISMKKLISDISKSNFKIPNSNELFSKNNKSLISVINLANSIPEINLGIYDSNSPLNAEKVALITKLWVIGANIRTIANECFEDESMDIQEKMNTCGKYIYSRLINNLPWGISAIYRAQGIVNPQNEEENNRTLIPSYVYFGVNNTVAVALCMLGVSRYAAHILSKEWYAHNPEIDIHDYEEIKRWIEKLTLDNWITIFTKYKGKNVEANYNAWIKNK